MALQKYVAGHARVHPHHVDFARLRQFRLLQRVAVSQPQNPVRQVARVAVRKHVHQLRREIRIFRAGRDVEHHPDRPDRLHVPFQRPAGVYQHVRTPLHRALVHGPPGEYPRIAAHRAATRRRRVARIELVMVLGAAPCGPVAQGAVTLERVGAAGAVQVEIPRARLLGRPLALRAPSVGAHHEDLDRRFGNQRRVFPHQPLVEPLQLQRAHRHRGLRSEIHTREFG